ncbi:MAG: NINE protein [Myxococcota bacterium]
MRILLLAAFVFLSHSVLANNSTHFSGAPCLSTNECDGQAFCNPDGKCQCLDGWSDLPKAACSYKEKSQAPAFILQALFGLLGAGEFYVNNNGQGAGQLILTVAVAIASGLNKAKEGKNGLLLGAHATLSLGAACWWLADLIRFGRNEVTDGNGYPLRGW